MLSSTTRERRLKDIPRPERLSKLVEVADRPARRIRVEVELEHGWRLRGGRC